jgi:hypothetical protein
VQARSAMNFTPPPNAVGAVFAVVPFMRLNNLLPDAKSEPLSSALPLEISGSHALSGSH